MFNLLCVFVDLSLHKRLVFLQLGQPLLQKHIFLPLIRNRLVISVADQLKSWDQVGHIVGVYCFKFMAHLFDLSAIEFNLLLVFL